VTIDKVKLSVVVPMNRPSLVLNWMTMTSVDGAIVWSVLVYMRVLVSKWQRSTSTTKVMKQLSMNTTRLYASGASDGVLVRKKDKLTTRSSNKHDGDGGGGGGDGGDAMPPPHTDGVGDAHAMMMWPVKL
jgi:hypothetical protein